MDGFASSCANRPATVPKRAVRGGVRSTAWQPNHRPDPPPTGNVKNKQPRDPVAATITSRLSEPAVFTSQSTARWVVIYTHTHSITHVTNALKTTHQTHTHIDEDTRTHTHTHTHTGWQTQIHELQRQQKDKEQPVGSGRRPRAKCE